MVLTFPEDLRTESIILRSFCPDDAPWVATACNRPEMARFVRVLPSPYQAADADAFVRHAREAWDRGSSAPFAIMAADGEPLGAIELHFHPVDLGLAGVGYWLRPEGRRRGAATEALRLVSSWAFDTLHIERLSLITDPTNDASQRVAERVGYQREGLLRAWHPTRTGRRDSVMFSLLPSDLSE